MSTNAAKLEKALDAACEKITKLNQPEFSSMTDKLRYLINSYRADGNPVGLYEVASETVHFLNSNKEKYSKQISQKLIDDIAKATTPEAAPQKEKVAKVSTAKPAAAPKKTVAKATVKDATATVTKAAPKKAAPKKDTTPKAPGKGKK